MKIGIIQNNSVGVNHHRLVVPYKYLQTEHDIELTNGFTKDSEYDCIIFNRGIHQSIADLEYQKKKGVKIVMDLDDWIELPIYHSKYNIYQLREISLIFQLMNLADVITTSTKYLQNQLFKLGYQSELLENFIDKTLPNNAEEHAIGWVGVRNHILDLSYIRHAMRHSYNANRIYGGYVKWGGDDEVQRRILSGDYKHPIEVREPLPIERYMELYKGITIGLLPSHNDTYSLCKSDLRAIEYSSMGIVGVTNGNIYRNTSAIKVEGREWIKEIKKLIKSKMYYNEKHLETIEWFKKRNDLIGITEKRKQIINNL